MTPLIRTLGAHHVEAADGTRLDLPPGKPFAVLVHLAIERRPVRRDELARLLWPGVPRDKALQSVRQAVWLVRRSVGEACLTGGDALEVVPEAVETDVDRLRAALGGGRVADALALWRGGFLERMAIGGTPEWDTWVDEVGHRVAHDLGAALHRAAVSERAAGRTEAAIELLSRAADADRYEPSHRVLLIGVLIDVRELDRAGLALSEARRDLADVEFAEVLDTLDARLQDALKRRGSDRDGLARPEFVGRAGELADLLRLWRTAAAGRVRLALLSGATGIGKTRLTEELAAAVAPDAGLVVSVRATETERALELGCATLLARRLLVMPGSRGVSGASDALLRSLLPSLETDHRPRDASSAHPAAFADALLDLLGAVAYEAPLVVVLDDLHWADAASLAVITRLLRQARTEPVLLVLTWRPQDLPAEAQRTFEHLAREEMAYALELRTLTSGEVTELLGLLVDYSDVTAADRIVERVYTATRGNPLFIVETLQALVEQGVLTWTDERWLLHVERMPDSFPLPRTLASVIGGRLDRLSEDAARIAAALATLPARAGINELRSATDMDEARFVPAVGELVERDIAMWHEGRLEFSHDQQREAVLRRWGRVRRTPYSRRRRFAVAAGITALLAAAGAAMGTLLSAPAVPLHGGGEAWLWFGDTLVIAEPPFEAGGEWTVRPVDTPVPAGSSGRVHGPWLTADGTRKWYRTRTDPAMSPWVVEWFPNGEERTIAQSLRHDAGGAFPSPDGRFVVYGMDDSTTAGYDVGPIIANSDGSEARRIFDGAGSTDGWSADGDWLLLVRNVRGAADTAFLVTPSLERGASLALDGTPIVGWCGPGRVRVWTQQGDSAVLRFWEPATGIIETFAGRAPDDPVMACSPDGSALIGTVIVDDHLETAVIDTRDGTRLPFPFGHRGRFDNVTWVPGALPRMVHRVRIAAAPDTLAWGERSVAQAAAEDVHGAPMNAAVTWRALDPDIVAIRPDGSLIANRPGSGRIVAVAGRWRADTATVTVSTEIAEPDALVFFDPFVELDTTRWMIVGEPRARAIVRDGEPALLVPADGNFADGVALAQPLALPRGVTIELEFRLPLTGAPNQYLNIYLVDATLRTGSPTTIEDWIIAQEITAAVPSVREVLTDLGGGLTVNRISATFDLPGEPDFATWNRMGLRVDPDGTSTLTFNGETVGQARMRVRDLAADRWWIVIAGGAQETELLIRNVRVWSVAR